MGNGNGLKEQWGVKDPAKAGSDQQAQQFQASFQKEIGCINGHLQYTSANAEAARHAPLEARRDALYPAFQSALGQIDRTDLAKAKGAIDKVLADAKALSGEVAAFRKEAEKACNDWKARQPKYDAAVHQVEELELWPDPKAGTLRALVDGIRSGSNERKFAPACVTLDQLLPKLKPIYDDYLKQKEARPKYEQMLAEQSARLDPLKAAERPSQPMTDKAGEADTALQQAQGKAETKDYVGGCEELKTTKGAIDALEKLAKAPERAKFLADWPTVDELVNSSADTTFKSLEASWQEIVQLRDQAGPAADSGDYTGANKLLVDLKTKVAACQKKLEELKQQKQAYEEALAALEPRLTGVSQSKFAKMEPLHTELLAVQGQMEAAAQGDDYVQALKLLQDLSAKVEMVAKGQEELEQQQKEYEDALKDLQPKLSEALESKYPSLAPKLDEISRLKGDMEGAAQKEEFPAATQTAQALGGKVDAFLIDYNKLKHAQEDYTKARAALKAKLDDALVSAREFSTLSGARADLISRDSAVESAATAQDFEKALQLVNELAPKVDDYLTKAKAEEDKYSKKGEEITKKLDDAGYFSRDEVARAEVDKLTPDDLKHLPTPIRNRLLAELQDGYFGDDEKEACKKLYSVKTLDPEFEKIDDANRKKMIEKIKNDPAFKEARAKWDTMTEAERVAIMKKAVDYQADAYGIPKTEIETYSKDDPTDYGYYNHSDGKLHVNAHDAALKKGGFDEAIDTAVHENGHRYQATLIDDLDSGKIKPGDPLYNQAMTFKLNDTHKGYYVQPRRGQPATPDTGDEYFTQPQENHSRITGTAVKNAGIGK